MLEPSTTDRLACAIFSGERAVSGAVGRLVDSGFATQSICVLLGHTDDEAEPDVPVQLRTGVRRFLPFGAGLGAAGGVALGLFSGASSGTLVPQLVTGLAAGALLGAMTAIVMGLGTWQHFVDFPEGVAETESMLVAVDLDAQGREEEARSALRQAGATAITICSSAEALELVREVHARELKRLEETEGGPAGDQ